MPTFPATLRSLAPCRTQPRTIVLDCGRKTAIADFIPPGDASGCRHSPLTPRALRGPGDPLPARRKPSSAGGPRGDGAGPASSGSMWISASNRKSGRRPRLRGHRNHRNQNVGRMVRVVKDRLLRSDVFGCHLVVPPGIQIAREARKGSAGDFDPRFGAGATRIAVCQRSSRYSSTSPAWRIDALAKPASRPPYPRSAHICLLP
jgi:hypothetical protein